MTTQQRVDDLPLSVIAEAALRIVDADGPDALTFRALGTALGTSHMRIHRAVGSLDGLLDLCVDHLAEQLHVTDPDLPWTQGTETRFIAFYQLLAGHPGLVALRRGRPWLSPQILARLVEPSLAANRRAGMTRRQAVDAYRQMYLFTLGSTAFVDHLNPRQAQQQTRTALASLDPEDYPELTESRETIVQAVVDHEVYYSGLRHLIVAVAPQR